METIFVRRTILTSIILFILAVGLFIFWIFQNKTPPEPPLVTKSEKLENIGPVHTVIGESVEGRKIDAYTYGDGKIHLVFIGGIHGGYEWNTVVLAYKFIDYLDLNPKVIPRTLIVTVIPSANPDGVYKIIGKEGRFTSLDVPVSVPTAPGRFNAHKVDLNRNFDCMWQPESTWQSKTVSAGTAPFSEPEAKIIRDFVLKNKPSAVVFWHSQSGAVYASECEDGILRETLAIMNACARASTYRAIPSFDAYETTGDAEGWLASIGIPTITVELKTHETVEWEQNLAGIKALFEYYK